MFNTAPFNFQSKAHSALHQAIPDFKTNTLPAEMAKIDLRSKIAPIWNALQEPIAIELATEQNLFFHFRPERIGLAPLSISNRAIETRITLSGRTHFTKNSASPFPEGGTTVPNLSGVPTRSKLKLTVPVKLKLQTLELALAEALPQTLPLNGAKGGNVTIHSATLTAENGKLLIRMTAKLEVDGIAPYFGSMTLSGSPLWESESATVTLARPILSIDDQEASATLLNYAAKSSAVSKILLEATRIPLKQELAKIEESIHTGFNREILSGVKSNGKISLTVNKISIDDRLNLIIQANGNLNIDVVTLR